MEMSHLIGSLAAGRILSWELTSPEAEVRRAARWPCDCGQVTRPVVFSQNEMFRYAIPNAIFTEWTPDRPWRTFP